MAKHMTERWPIFSRNAARTGDPANRLAATAAVAETTTDTGWKELRSNTEIHRLQQQRQLPAEEAPSRRRTRHFSNDLARQSAIIERAIPPICFFRIGENMATKASGSPLL